jgi:hypothetical protein
MRDLLEMVREEVGVGGWVRERVQGLWEMGGWGI